MKHLITFENYYYHSEPQSEEHNQNMMRVGDKVKISQYHPDEKLRGLEGEVKTPTNFKDPQELPVELEEGKTLQIDSKYLLKM